MRVSFEAEGDENLLEGGSRGGPRVLLYSHDTYGLGHFRRSLLLARAIAREMPEVSILCATGSPRSHSFPLPPRFDYLKLPSITKDAEGRYRSRVLDLTLPELRALRSRILRSAALAFRPDLVLVDQAVLGTEGEFLPGLRALRRRSPGTRLVFGSRDVIDAPERVIADWRKPGPREALRDLYDAIFVYGSPEVFDFPAEYRLPASVAGKVRFLGYLAPDPPPATREAARAALGIEGRRMVLVTVGGGGDGDLLVRSWLKALRGAADPGYDSIVVTGPLMSPRKRSTFREEAAAAPGVRLLEFSPNLPDLVAAADAVVSMAGYNAVCEAVWCRRPALFVPRSHPRLEQSLRAERFARLGLARVLDPDGLSPRALRGAVERLLSGDVPRPRIALDFQGGERAAREVAGLLEGCRPLPPHAAIRR
jgi:predicted glycosyltransferase